LIIELDGGHHSDPEVKQLDRIRQNFLLSKGFKVIRFWNNEVQNNFEGVILEILKYL
jgi:very-short-patch-repair endonuclease